MANLPEANEWPAGIYQLETTDPVLGGPPNEATKAGVDNIPHQQLAKRTNWLKSRVDELIKTVVAASTAVAGIVRLSNAVNSASTTMAATPAAVKAVYDEAVRLTGDQDVSGQKNFDRVRIGGQILSDGATNAKAQVNGFFRTGNIYLHSHEGDNAANPVVAETSSLLMRRRADGKLVYENVSGVVWTDTDASRSRAQNGYEKLPSGLIIQWAAIIVPANETSASGAFPISFPTASMHIWAFRETVSIPTVNDMLTAISNGQSAFTLRTLANANSRQFTVFAIGY